MSAAMLFVVSATPLFGACKPAPLPGEPNAREGRTVMRAEENRRDDIPLASVSGRAITLEEFERRLEQRGVEAQRYFADADTRPELLERLLWFEVMANTALANGWNDAPESPILELDYVAHAVLRDMTPPDLHAASFDDGEVHAAWDAIERDVVPVERRRVWAVLYPERAAAEDAMRELQAWTEEGRDSMFELVRYEARASSLHDASRTQSGELGWVVRREDGGDLDPALEALIFEAEANSLAGVVDVTDGALLVYVATVMEAREPELEASEMWMRQRMADEARAEWRREQLDRWRDASTVRIDEAAVAALSAARTQPVPEDPPQRFRRYDTEAMAGLEARTFGPGWNSLAADTDAAYRGNPMAAAFEVVVPDGSGDAAGPDLVPDP